MNQITEFLVKERIVVCYQYHLQMVWDFVKPRYEIGVEKDRVFELTAHELGSILVFITSAAPVDKVGYFSINWDDVAVY